MIDGDLKTAIAEACGASDDPAAFVHDLREWIHKELSPVASQPVDMIHWVKIDRVQANDYNPNSVASAEMRLLYVSIRNDGYTQPIVTIYDEQSDKYVIVDGFHRYEIARSNPDILERNQGLLPVVVLNKGMNDRMAATIRHNRARGKHSVQGMSSLVFSMLDNGWADDAICNNLGMEPEELLRLKHITGFSKLFSNAAYSQAWETKRQIRLRVNATRAERKK